MRLNYLFIMNQSSKQKSSAVKFHFKSNSYIYMEGGNATLLLAERTRKSHDSDAATAGRKREENMAPRLELVTVGRTLVWLVVSCLVPPVEAYDAGDALALLLCAVLTGVGLCACLGWYARRRNYQM